MEIVVESLNAVPIEKQKIEIVERKGIGHPDSVADGLAETVSRALSKEYLQNFGYILHHNTDECQIVGGQSQPQFGGGVIIEPAYILLVGRATALHNGKRMPIRAISVKAAHEYLEKNFRNLNADTDVVIESKIWEGSQDLKSVYDPRRMLANDTSVGAGYAPLSETEKLTLQLERFININLKKFPEAGEDVKVMSARKENKINITVAMAMVDRYIPDATHYISVKEQIREELADYATTLTDKEISLEINTADDYEKGIYYLTVTGLSMENGDDGSVGRGNRLNGLITPNRPVSMEAPAGKNPVTHVGKLYNITATRIAETIVKEYSEVEEAYVKMLSQIGRPIKNPLIVGISIVGKLPDSGVEEIVREHIDRIDKIKDDILAGKISVF